MTIHPIRLTGMVIGVPQTFEYLDKMQERVIKFVTRHSDIEEDTFKELMFAKGNLTRDIGTNIIGQEAVDNKLMHAVGGVGQAMRKLDELMKKNSELPEGGLIQ